MLIHVQTTKTAFKMLQLLVDAVGAPPLLRHVPLTGYPQMSDAASTISALHFAVWPALLWENIDFRICVSDLCFARNEIDDHIATRDANKILRILQAEYGDKLNA